MELGGRRQVRCQSGKLEPLWEAWQLAREDASDACHGWLAAAHDDRARAYNAYVAAADREAAASALLSARTHRR